MIPFLHLGPLTVPTFGLMFALAGLCAYLVLKADLKRRNIAADAGYLVAIPTACGILGAKLYHLLESPREFMADPVSQILSQSGFAWFGGLIAGTAAFMYLGRKYRIPMLSIFDVASPAAALAYAIGRIGCLLSGDGDYGIPTSLPWGMSFPNGLVPTPERVHPTPIYEFVAGVLIAVWLWQLGKPKKGVGSTGTGRVFAAYLIATGIARFLVEFIRINPRSFFGLSNAQAASLFSILLGCLVLVYIRKRRSLRQTTAAVSR